MILTTDVKDTVDFLYILQGESYLPIGSCFYLNVVEGSRVFTYLVTTKHVIEATTGQDLFLPANRRDARQAEYLKLQSPWIYHPNPAVNLAVSLREGVPGTYPIRTAAIPSDWIVRPERLRGALVEGLEVFFMGKWSQSFRDPKNLPIMRQGHIALIPDEPIEGPYGSAAYYLVECASFPADSGAPLFMPAQSKDGQPLLALLGVVTAAFPDRALTNSENSRGSGPASGIILVTPGAYILEVLEQDELVELRRTGAGVGRLRPDRPRFETN